MNLSDFKDDLEVASKLIKYSDPEKKRKPYLFGQRVFF